MLCSSLFSNEGPMEIYKTTARSMTFPRGTEKGAARTGCALPPAATCTPSLGWVGLLMSPMGPARCGGLQRRSPLHRARMAGATLGRAHITHPVVLIHSLHVVARAPDVLSLSEMYYEKYTMTDTFARLGQPMGAHPHNPLGYPVVVSTTTNPPSERALNGSDFGVQRAWWLRLSVKNSR